MIPIGVRRFPKKRVIGPVAMTFLVLSGPASFADPIFLPVKATPYDRQMARIQSVLTSARLQETHCELSLGVINRWIGQLRNIPYRFSMQWKTPAEVDREPVADCKGKAIALYQAMAQHGARGLRLIIGRRAPTSRCTHAWVEWTTPAATYVLDPTINSTAQTLDELADNAYVPYYAYAGRQKYRAPAASALLAGL